MDVGIDIGGTKVLAILMDDRGQVRARAKKRVAEPAPERVLDLAWRAVREALEEHGQKRGAIRRVGIAVPSAVQRGVAVHAPALGWRDAPVAKLAARIFRRPVFVGNDVNLGLAAEYRLGAARKATTVVGFFVGTGVGGAIIHRGELLEGHDGMAGELGHMVVVPEGRRCGCGNAGCLEAYASKTAILRRLQEAIFTQGRPSAIAEAIGPDDRTVRSSVLRRAYRLGDPLVREVLHEGLKMLGPAIASVLNSLSPERVVLGGGVIEAFGEPLVKKIRGWTEPYVFGKAARAEAVVPSALGDDAVPVGAALLARRNGSTP